MNGFLTDCKFWLVDYEWKCTPHAVENAAPDIKKFYKGPQRFFEVRSPLELEARDPDSPPSVLVFDFI